MQDFSSHVTRVLPDFPKQLYESEKGNVELRLVARGETIRIIQTIDLPFSRPEG